MSINADIKIPEPSHFLHEAWFELCRVRKTKTLDNISVSHDGVLLVNSYGRVRYVFDDGTYFDVYDGKYSDQGEWLIEKTKD